MLTDSHAHLDHERYAGDRAEILRNAWAAGVCTILAIGIGDGPSTMHRALDISREYAGQPKTPQIFASAGIHPSEAALADPAALATLDQLLAAPEVIATGEIGLDYYHPDNPSAAIQKQAFIEQMEIAAVHRKPIIIHCRPSDGSHAADAAAEPGAVPDAWDDTLSLIEQHWKPTHLGGILHCFTGEWDQAQRALDSGFMISFAGNITFPRAQSIRDTAAQVPLDRMLIETDAPFLAPAPNRGKRNEPAWVAQVAEQIGALRGIEANEVAEETSRNFRRFFNIG